MVAFPSRVPFEYADADAIAEFMRPWLEPWMHQAYAVLTDPTRTFRGEYDVDTDTQTIIPYVAWHGPCRVQPIRTDLNSIRPVNDSTTRAVQFWLPFPKDQTIPDVRPGFMFAVTDGGNDPYLELYDYSVVGSLNSSMAWQRTVNTVTDLELRPDWNIGWVDVPVDASSVASEFDVGDGVWRTAFEGGSGVSRAPTFVGGSVDRRVRVDGVVQPWV